MAYIEICLCSNFPTAYVMNSFADLCFTTYLLNVISVESFHSSKIAVVLEERNYLTVSVSPLPVRSHSAGPGRVRGWAACKSEIANISPLSNGAQQPPHTS